jgi:hypothetical protein
MSEPGGRTFTLPTRAWIALAVFAALQIGLLAMNVLGIGRQKELLQRQLGLAEQSYDATRPAVQDARRLLDDARDRLPQTRRRARDAARLVEVSAPLVADLRQNGRLVALVDHTQRLLDQLERAGTVEAIRDARGVMHQLLSIQRRTLSAQLQALEVQRATLTTQQQALGHIRSLDRKTGGQLPTP